MSGSKVMVAAVGCKLNQAEGDMWKAWFKAKGYAIIDGDAEPDLCLVTTCTVTAQADRSSVSLISRLHRQYPKSRIKVTGCGATNIPERFSRLPGVTEIIGYAEKEKRIGAVSFGHDGISARCIERNRAFLRVGDGCDRRCSYCVVSKLRGGVNSKPAQAILEELHFLAEEGFGEAVLVALNLGVWGKERGESLASLVARIDAERGDLPRIRLTSLEPDTVTEELIEVMTSCKGLCPHFHIPLQSGDDAMLARMTRPYTTKDYAALLERILKASPDACLGSDIITSAPGEDEESFSITLEFVKAMPLSHLHVFTYSARRGTPMARQHSSITRSPRERTRLLREAGERMSLGFRKRFLGQSREAVLLSATRVLTDNYIDVKISESGREVRSLAQVKIVEVCPKLTRGSVS